MIGFLPEVIILMSGGFMKEVGKDGKIRYHSTTINEGDAFGILWGKARILAVAELAVHFPKTKVLITSIPSSSKNDARLFIYEELKKLSIQKNRIIIEEKSTNSLSQICEAVKIIYNKKMKSAVFITNEYHIPRVRTLYENIEALNSDKKTLFILHKIRSSKSQMEFVAAENILPIRNSKYIKIIDQMKKKPTYLKRVRNEKLGLLMINKGNYGKRKITNIKKLERVYKI